MCTICGAQPQGGRALCASCARRLDNPRGLCVEHISWTDAPPRSIGAALVDHWGRPHCLRDKTIIGRVPGDGITVLESSISRHHAELTRDVDGWHLRDLRSRNGTYVAGTPIVESTPLESEQIITFGDVAFFFLERPELTTTADVQIATAQQPERRRDDESGANPPWTSLRLVAPPGDVGGIATLNGVPVSLSPIQFAFVTMLAERICAEVDEPRLVRGYVPSSELLAKLPWDASTPVSNNVKQLVRRVRNSMASAGFGDVIESRARFGYRLRCILQTND